MRFFDLHISMTNIPMLTWRLPRRTHPQPYICLIERQIGHHRSTHILRNLLKLDIFQVFAHTHTIPHFPPKSPPVSVLRILRNSIPSTITQPVRHTQFSRLLCPLLRILLILQCAVCLHNPLIPDWPHCRIVKLGPIEELDHLETFSHD